MVDNQVQI